jgi:hypothetical protein
MESKLHGFENVVLFVRLVHHIIAHIQTPVQVEHCPRVLVPHADLRILSGPTVRQYIILGLYYVELILKAIEMIHEHCDPVAFVLIILQLHCDA